MRTEPVRLTRQETKEPSPRPLRFKSLSSLTLTRVEERGPNATESSSIRDEAKIKNVHISKEGELVKALRGSPWSNPGPSNDSGRTESKPVQVQSLRPQVPRGVIRGCSESDNRQKVVAKWSAEECCRPDLEDAPVFHPTEEEFEDALGYIAKIRPKAEAYGICCIVPPKSWQPPCALKQKEIWENSKFRTRAQQIHKLQNRDSGTEMSGIKNQKRKRRKCLKAVSGYGGEGTVVNSDAGIPETFGFGAGPQFTLQEFQDYADHFKTEHFRKSNIPTRGKEKPLVEDIEEEYWRIIQKRTEEIEVLYGNDLQTGVLGSGFPKNTCEVGSASDAKYVRSEWNLNNFPKLPGSIFSYESGDIPGVLAPWLYVGMCFSSFCWHVEDHHLYSVNYLHWGEPKVWYGVPGVDALKLEAAMRKHLPGLFEEQPDLLHNLITQLSPSILKKEHVSVYRCVQNAGEFVLTFPRAYHAGFSCGFNCAEAVNVAPVDWLPYGQHAIDLYREEGRKTTISHDKLLLGAAKAAVKAQWEQHMSHGNTSDTLRRLDVRGKDGILFKALKARVKTEKTARAFGKCKRALRMENSFDAKTERECSVCLYDLHLSAVGCYRCSPDKYACLMHAEELCSCSWGAKFFLFRHDMKELNLLLEAVEGKPSAIYKWAKMEGLSLSVHKTRDNSQLLNLIGCSKDTKGCSELGSSYDEANAERVGHKGKMSGNLIPKPEKTKPSFQANDDVLVLSDDDSEQLSLKPHKKRIREEHMWSSGRGVRKTENVRADMFSSVSSKSEDHANGETDTKLNRPDDCSIEFASSGKQCSPRSLVQNPELSSGQNNLKNCSTNVAESSDQLIREPNVFSGLLKTADSEELQALSIFLNDSKTDIGLMKRLLNEEINQRPR